METLYYTVEVKDKNNKLFIDSAGNKVTNRFKFTDNTNKDFIQLVCEDTFKAYQAITGSNNINISVSRYSDLTETYMTLYTYYGKDKRFVKH